MLVIHIFFAAISFVSFVGRIILSELKPQLLTAKIFKIAPHVIDTFLLASGVSLVIMEKWLASGEYTWIISKFLVLLVYIGLGFLAMRSTGMKRWLAFAGALGCYGYILVVAITKQGFI